MSQIGYVVSHTHWDREWRYPIWRNRLLLIEFMETLMATLEEDPEYAAFLTDGQCVLIDDYLEIHPEHEDRLAKLIADGRISIGPWYTLPDLYPISGESIIRNLLTGTRKAASYGRCLQVGYNSFGWGQTAQFPQIYAGFGIDFVIAAKNVSKTRAPKSEFLWESPDGTRILTSRLGQHKRANFFMNAYVPIMYGKSLADSNGFRFEWGATGASYHSADNKLSDSDHFSMSDKGFIHPEWIQEGMDTAWAAMDETTVSDHRLMMNGSDFSTPQPKLSEMLRLANELEPERQFRISSLEEYAQILKEHIKPDELAVVKGELRDGPASSVSGNALATRSYLKTLNKRVQQALFGRAEVIAVVAEVLGGSYHRSMLEKSKEFLLQSHAHDSINGVTQDKTAEDTRYRLNQADEINRAVTDDGYRQILSCLDTSGFPSDALLLAVFNTSPNSHSDILEITLDLPREWAAWDFDILDSNGTRLDKAIRSRREMTVAVHDFNCRPWPFKVDRYQVTLATNQVPGVGYDVYQVLPTERFDREQEFWASMRHVESPSIAADPRTLENSRLLVEVNGNGSVKMTDKTSGQVFDSLNYFEDSGDVGDYWVHYPPYSNEIINSLGSAAEIQVEDNSSLSATIVARTTIIVPARADKPDRGISGYSRRVKEHKDVTIVCRYTLRRDEDFLRVSTTVENTAEDHRLRVLFDTGILAEFSDAAGHFTVDRRPVAFRTADSASETPVEPEMQTLPMQEFVDVSHKDSGFAIIHNCLSEYEVLANHRGTVALTLFRAVRNTICTEYRVGSSYPEQNGGQSPGLQTYEYNLHPHSGNWKDAALFRKAEVLRNPLQAVQFSPVGKGTQPVCSSLVGWENPNVVYSALKKTEERDSYILRVFNPTNESQKTTFRFGNNLEFFRKVSLNEEAGDEVDLDSPDAVSIGVDHHRIQTFEFQIKDIKR